MKFNTYQSHFEQFLNECHKNNDTTKSAIQRLNTLYERNFGYSFYESMDGKVAMYDLTYIGKGKKIIYMNNETAEYLYNLRYSASNVTSIEFVHDCFSVAFESNAVVNGVRLMPILGLYNHTNNIGIDRLSELSGHTLIDNSGSYPSSTFSLVTYENESNHCLRISISFSPKELTEIINFDPEHQEEKMAEVLSDFKKANALNEDDFKRLCVSMRILISLSIYNQITDQKYLIDGFPFELKQKPKALGVHKKDMNNVTPTFFKVAHATRTNGSPYVRPPHFRNLVDDRFYRGIHKDKPKGSRWVEVKQTLVGGKNLQTQTKEN